MNKMRFEYNHKIAPHPSLTLSIIFLSICIACISGLAWSFGLINPPAFSYLLPWIVLVLLATSGPVLFLAYRGEWNMFHPIIYAAWSYFIPVFVIGTSTLVFGLPTPFFFPLITDQEHHLSLTLLLVAVGFFTMFCGFLLPTSRKLGKLLEKQLPSWTWTFDDLLVPCMLMIGLGEMFRLQAFLSGSTGFQLAWQPSLFGNLQESLSSFSDLAVFCLWYTLFKQSALRAKHFVIAASLVVTSIYWVSVLGNKSSLLTTVILVIAAFSMSGRKTSTKIRFWGLGLIAISLLLGFLYGTSFRSLKGSIHANLSINEYLQTAYEATVSLLEPESLENFGYVGEKFLHRLENTTSLAVIVANYEQLRPREHEYGLLNNIWVYTWTAFIPRFLWPDKPLISDARSVGALYFNFPDNSFAINPIGDLLRNYGLPGVPLGMSLLGAGFAVIYYALHPTSSMSVWRAALLYTLITGVSFEGFFGTLLPSLMRASMVVLVFGLCVQGIVQLNSRIRLIYT